MAATSSEQIRSWTGPAILSYGFRPFFLLGALWAAFAMVMWIFMLSGQFTLPTRFDPVSWHGHEFLFGYLSAVLAGFLLTAVPNWTGRLPLVGWPLGGLVALWAAGRLVVACSEVLPETLVALVDLSFPVVLAAVILREIVAGKNWNNLIVLGMLSAFALANLLFHLEAAWGTHAAQGMGLRFGVAAAVMMISVVGGRIVPSFTRNWLAKSGREARPAPPMQGFDKAVLLVTLMGLAVWAIWPEWMIAGVMLIGVSVLQVARLLRWQGLATGAEPLVWVLHLGYAFIPLGALAAGLAIVFPNAIGLGAAQHFWMAGAIGLMTLAVMTRATLGHSGRDLHAGPATSAIYLALIGAVAARLSAAVFPEAEMTLYALSAFLWVSAFSGFAVVYGALLMRSKHKTG
ncbi:MAG: NnrS family protein [Alphaproteobacteria bacterium]|nr:NnrS family protein [Alphaproteobacteria bacterium]